MSPTFDCPHLPPELWLQVVRHLTPRALHSLSQTCQSLHTVVTDESLFRAYYLRHYPPPPPLLLQTYNWQTIYGRNAAIRTAPRHEVYWTTSPLHKVAVVGDVLILHERSNGLLRAAPPGWTIRLDFLKGDASQCAVELLPHTLGLVDAESEEGDTAHIHLIDVRTGRRESRRLPAHPSPLMALPGTKALVQASSDGEAVVYATGGMLRVVRLMDMEGCDRGYPTRLVWGETGVSGWVDEDGRVWTLKGEAWTKIPLTEYTLQEVASSESGTVTARHTRGMDTVAITLCGKAECWTTLHRGGGAAGALRHHGDRAIQTPGRECSRLVAICGHAVHGVRAVRVEDAPFDWGDVGFGANIVLVGCRARSIVSVFDLEDGVCLRSLRAGGAVRDWALVGGAWLVALADDRIEVWRFGRVSGLFQGWERETNRPSGGAGIDA